MINQHGLILVEALALGLLTGLTSFRVFIRALRSSGARRNLWLGMSSLIAGALCA